MVRDLHEPKINNWNSIGITTATRNTKIEFETSGLRHSSLLQIHWQRHTTRRRRISNRTAQKTIRWGAKNTFYKCNRMVLNAFDMNMQSLADKKITFCLILFLFELFFDGELSMLFIVCSCPIKCQHTIVRVYDGVVNLERAIVIGQYNEMIWQTGNIADACQIACGVVAQWERISWWHVT